MIRQPNKSSGDPWAWSFYTLDDTMKANQYTPSQEAFGLLEIFKDENISLILQLFFRNHFRYDRRAAGLNEKQDCHLSVNVDVKRD